MIRREKEDFNKKRDQLETWNQREESTADGDPRANKTFINEHYPQHHYTLMTYGHRWDLNTTKALKIIIPADTRHSDTETPLQTKYLI